MIKRNKDLVAGGITPELLKGCIAEHRRTVDRFSKLDGYYTGKHDILNRRQKHKDSPNNKIVANFPKYITDTAIGYMFSNPITYQSETGRYRRPKGVFAEGENHEDDSLEDLRAANDRADMDTHDAELGKDLSVFGVGFELVYMSDDERPAPKAALLDPREAFIVYDDTVAVNPLFGVYYYKLYSAKGETSGYSIIVYTTTAVLTYVTEKLDGEPAFKDEQPHFFGGIPLIQYWNNEEGMGDFEHVMSIVDAYNTLQSDRVNDKERFLSAILVIKNAELEMDDGEATSPNDVINSGVLQLPGTNSDADYLTKTLNETETEVLKKSLVADIHKFSQTPDFTDERFSGNTSGVAMKYKLLSLEYLAKVKERFLVSGIKDRIRLFANILYIQGKAPFDVGKISIVFNRTLPINELENAQTAATLKGAGLASTETLLSQITAVKDVGAEMEKLAAEKAESLSQQMAAFNRQPVDMMW